MNWKAQANTKEQQQVKPASDSPSAVRQAVRVPAVSIHETDHAIALIADMPGVTQDGVEITIEQDVLTMRGTVKPDVHDGFKLLHREYAVASFERSFTVPAEIDSQHVAATVKHGVLSVILPKQKAVQPRRVTVKAG